MDFFPFIYCFELFTFQLLHTAESSIVDVHGLHAKLDRKRSVEEHNQHVQMTFQENFHSNLTAMRQELTHFANTYSTSNSEALNLLGLLILSIIYFLYCKHSGYFVFHISIIATIVVILSYCKASGCFVFHVVNTMVILLSIFPYCKQYFVIHISIIVSTVVASYYSWQTKHYFLVDACIYWEEMVVQFFFFLKWSIDSKIFKI